MSGERGRYKGENGGDEVREGQSESGEGSISISPSTRHTGASEVITRAWRYASNTFYSFFFFEDMEIDNSCVSNFCLGQRAKTLFDH